MSEGILNLGLPSGSLQDATLELFGRAGYEIVVSQRSYSPAIDDEEIECTFIRAQEMARYVALGTLDAGITGLDWIRETESDVEQICELVFSKVSRRPARWVLCVPENSPIESVQDLQGKRIATEIVNTTRNWLARHNVEAEVEFSWGSTEAKTPKLVDAIVELTETGSSIQANKLRIVEEILQSTPRLIANKEAVQDVFKRKKIEDIALMLTACLRAEGKAGLMMNVRQNDLERVIQCLPALQTPTISSLSDSDWVAVNTIIEESVVRTIVPRLKAAGAKGIVEYAINKLIE